MGRLDRQTRVLIRKMHEAFRQYPMLRDGDKIAVAVSGGYDSLSLLHLLQIRMPIVPEHYALVAIHIQGDSLGPAGQPAHQPLIDWLAASGVEYVVEPMKLAEGEKLPMGCYRCTWNRRSTLFQVANRLGCNKIAFGHNFDDMVQTALMNLFYQGSLTTMYPYASYFGGMFSLIRPLMYITKRELEDFARANGFPDPPPQCPNSGKTQRKEMADLLLSIEGKNRQNISRNIFRASMSYMKSKGLLGGKEQLDEMES